jgi:hypothetical protein
VRVTVRTLNQQPALESHIRRFHQWGWPSFLRDDAANALWPALYTSFREFQFALLDGGRRVVAIGNSIPFVWDGRPAHLPERIADLLARGIDDRAHGRRPTALSALAAIVEERHRGLGLSARVIRAMAQLAARHRLRYLVAPVRPSLKGHYPLTPMEHYAGWTDGSGGPFDPWLRVHWRLGARAVGIAPHANTVQAPVAAWQEWTGLRFPESGRYIVPGAFQPIRVDRKRDRVYYGEANVWMRHPDPRVDRRPGRATGAGVSSRRRR